MFVKIESPMDVSSITESSNVCIIEFTASWCSQCKMMKPLIAQIEEIYKEKLYIGIVDVDKNRDIAKDFGIISLPYFIVYQNNVRVEDFQMKPKTQIVNIIDKYLRSEND